MSVDQSFNQLMPAAPINRNVSFASLFPVKPDLILWQWSSILKVDYVCSYFYVRKQSCWFKQLYYSSSKLQKRSIITFTFMHFGAILYLSVQQSRDKGGAGGTITPATHKPLPHLNLLPAMIFVDAYLQSICYGSLKSNNTCFYFPIHDNVFFGPGKNE